jgi:hypothetical protein
VTRQLAAVTAMALLAGSGFILAGGTVHEAVRYAAAVATGMLLGLGLARR